MRFQAVVSNVEACKAAFGANLGEPRSVATSFRKVAGQSVLFVRLIYYVRRADKTAGISTMNDDTYMYSYMYCHSS